MRTKAYTKHDLKLESIAWEKVHGTKVAYYWQGIPYFKTELRR